MEVRILTHRLQVKHLFVQDDIIGVAFDCDNSTIQFYKNGSTFGSQFDYSAQSNAVDTSDGDTYAPIVMGDNTTYTNKVGFKFWTR